MIKYNCEQGSEAWHDLRCGKFTGTSFSDVMAGESTDTYKKLIKRIAAEVISGISEPTYSNFDMERGIELEPFARAEYELIMSGIEVEQVGFISPEDTELTEWVGFSPDGLVGLDGGCEFKCPKSTTHLEYMRANKMPTTYKWQVQGALLVTKRDWWDFMSFYPKMKPFLIRVLPDEEMQKELRVRLIQAIQDVKMEIKMYERYEISEQV